MKNLRVFSFFIIISLLLCNCISALDTEAEYAVYECKADFSYSVLSEQKLGISLFGDNDATLNKNIEAAKEYILEEIKAFNDTIYLSEFEIPIDYSDAIFSDIFHYNPELFYLNPFCDWYYNPDTGNIGLVKLSFAYTPSQYATRKAIFDEEVNKIISTLNVGMTDLQKALAIHDYIAVNCDYDNDAVKDLLSKPVAFRADGIIVDKLGVCQSYSLAYYYILNRLGIVTDYAQSNDMNHVWNVVKIDGKWYHTDITWDDTGLYAHTGHQYFLLSDELIVSLPDAHYNWLSKQDCTDTSYDNAFWRNSDGNIAFDKNNFAYYQDNFEIKKYNFQDKESTLLYSIPQKWVVWENTDYVYIDSFSSVVFASDKLYFNTPYAIMEMNTDGSGAKAVISYAGGDGLIYGILLDDSRLYFNVSTSPSATDYQIYFTLLKNQIGVTRTDENPTTLYVNILRKFFDYETVPGTLIATLYNENDTIIESLMFDLSSLGIVDTSSEIIVDFNSTSGSHIKLLWWDMDTLSPLSISQDIDISI